MKPASFSAHAEERVHSRGTTKQEIQKALRFSAWKFVEEEDRLMVVTVYVYFIK